MLKNSARFLTAASKAASPRLGRHTSQRAVSAISTHQRLAAARAFSTSTFRLNVQQELATSTATAHKHDPNVPKVNISADNTTLTLTPPPSSRFYRAHHPSTVLDALWLRDNCPCEKCVHPSNRQKLHASTQVPLDIAVSSAQVKTDGLELTWNKGLEDVGDWEEPAKAQPGHKSFYPWEMILGSYGGTAEEHRATSRFNHAPKLWDNATMEKNVLWLDYNEYMETPQGLLEAVKHLQDYGLFFLKNVPTRDQEVATAAERIGHLRHTFYGRTWDVKSVPNAKNIAYTNLNLGLHMDLLYMEAPPGLQLLHSLENSVPGGTSIFMDSFKAVELLKQNHPEDYEILTKVPVTFHYNHYPDHHLHFTRPTIALDPHNSTMVVNYAPPFQGPLEIPAEQMKKFYAAFKKFAAYIEQPDLQYRHTMRPGECMVFANRRVLHARTAFDPTKGKRHLKGCYVDLDMFRDKYRVMVQAERDGTI